MVELSPGGRDRIALFILALGAVAVVLASAPYKSFDLDRYFVPKELALHVCALGAALVCLKGTRRLTGTAVDLLLAAFLVSSALSAVLATNRWAAERALAISLSGAALFWVASAIRRAGMERPLLVALATGVVIGSATCLAQAYGIQSDYFSLNRAPGGTFGNRNFAAHLAAIGTPVLVLVALTARGGLGSLAGALGMAIVAATLVLSRSRAAWLAVIALAATAGPVAFLLRRRWHASRTARRSMVLATSAAVGAVAAIILPNRLEWKSDSPYLDSAAGIVNYKQGSGAGRLVQYGNSLRMLRVDPLLGVGPGNWPVAYPHYASRNDPSLAQDDGLTANPWPSSDWVAYLSERGGIGFGLVLAAILGLFVRALRDVSRGDPGDSEGALTTVALVGTLVATAVVGAFDAVLLIAVPTFFFWTLAGALAPPSPDGARFPLGTRGPVLALVIVLGVITVGRSATQLASMAVYNSSSRLSALQQAATLDPGSYRLHARLAQAYLSRGDCARARANAHAARDLFPSAGEPKRVIAACGGR